MSLRRGLTVTASATMISRVLGMLRDMATAYRFGASAVMDALVLALRIPDLFRRMFGDGVLGASLIPVFRGLYDEPKRAWRFFSAALLLITLAPLLAVGIGEAVCGWQLMHATNSHSALAPQMTAIVLPYVVLVCLLAQLAAGLQALERFTAPAFAPCILNLVWISACVAAPRFAGSLADQGVFLVWAVVASGLLQVAFLAGNVWALGWRPTWPDHAAWHDARKCFWALVPAGLAISSTQLNTTVDGVLAWSMSQNNLAATGAASAIYFGERMFMLPVGVVGIATAVVVFPSLCRQADEQQFDEMADHVAKALRGMLLLAIPASAGLVLLARPVVALLLQRGEFSSADSERAAQVAMCYGIGIWAFVAIPLLARVELAMRRPWQAGAVGALMIGVHALLAWAVGRFGPWEEAGLALATSVCAGLQVVWLFVAVRRQIPLRARMLAPALARILIAAGLMSTLVWVLRQLCTEWLSKADSIGIAGAAGVWLSLIGVAAAFTLPPSDGCDVGYETRLRLLREGSLTWRPPFIDVEPSDCGKAAETLVCRLFRLLASRVAVDNLAPECYHRTVRRGGVFVLNLS